MVNTIMASHIAHANRSFPAWIYRYSPIVAKEIRQLLAANKTAVLAKYADYDNNDSYTIFYWTENDGLPTEVDTVEEVPSTAIGFAIVSSANAYTVSLHDYCGNEVNDSDLPSGLYLLTSSNSYVTTSSGAYVQLQEAS